MTIVETIKSQPPRGVLRVILGNSSGPFDVKIKLFKRRIVIKKKK